MTAEQRNMDPGAGARLGLEADGRDVNGRDADGDGLDEKCLYGDGGDKNSRNGDLVGQG